MKTEQEPVVHGHQKVADPELGKFSFFLNEFHLCCSADFAKWYRKRGCGSIFALVFLSSTVKLQI